MGIFVRFDPNSTSKQSDLIPSASDNSEGVVTLDQVRRLSGGAGTVFIFRPGAVAPLASNVYNDWVALMAAVGTQQGFRTIEFDDSIVSPCVIPAGNWNMNGVTLSGTVTFFYPDVKVRVLEGAVFTGLRNIDGALSVEFTGSTPPVTDFTTGVETVLFINEASILQCTGTGPFVRNATPGSNAVIALSLSGQLASPTGVPVFDIAAPGATGVVAVFDAGQVAPNTVSGVAGSVLIEVVLGSSGFIDVNQPAFLGTVQQANLTYTRINPSDFIITSSNSPYSAQMNSLNLLDLTTGNINVVLPSAKNSRGMTVIVNNTATVPSANSCTVSPQPGNTVNGGPSDVFVGNSNASRTYISDGALNWLLVSVVN